MQDLRDMCESLLDDEDDLMAAADKVMDKKWIEDNCTGDFKMSYTKKGMRLAKGTLIIKNLVGELPEFVHFVSVKGDIHIEKCNDITNINNLFDPYCDCIGDINISLCPKLVSLKGLPIYIKGNLTVVGNKSLKDIDANTPVKTVVTKKVNFAKNSTRWKEGYISKYFEVIGQINCSLDDESVMEGVVNEALNEPHLLELAKQLIDDKKGLNFGKIVQNLHYKWDEITSSNVKEYEAGDKKGLTAARRIISSGVMGMVLGKIDGKYKYVMLPRKDMYNLVTCRHIWDLTTGDLISILDGCDEIVVVNLGKEERTYDIKSQREIAQKGIVKMGDAEYNKKIAKENINRYKEIIAQNKIKKDKDFEKIDKLVQNVLNGVMQAVMNVHKDPAKYADVSWKLYLLQEAVYSQRTYNRGNSHGEDGLLKVYNMYNENYMHAHEDKSNSLYATSSEVYIKGMEACKERIYKIVSEITNRLTAFGVTI